MTSLLRSRLALALPAVTVERREDGVSILRSTAPLSKYARCVGDWLTLWATDAPTRDFLLERASTKPDAPWRSVTYGETYDQVRRIGAALLKRELGPDRPLLILSGNSIRHALLALGAMHVGVPVVPVSVAYALLSTDFAKVRAIVAQVNPGMVFAEQPDRFTAALSAIAMKSVTFDELLEDEPGTELDAAHLAVGPDTVAKILFTSGSTGTPKGVINTQRMLTSNQQQSLQVWPFTATTPPVVVDWLPWSHTFGGNYNLHLVLCNGGTLHIDAGKPTTPGDFAPTLRNLREVAPTMYFNVPRGFDMLLPELEGDATFRKHFLSRCEFIFYAGAALSSQLWARMERLGADERAGDLALVSSWGSTETAPLCAAVHFPVGGTGVIGLPVPGLEIKLVPSQGKLEARVRGPNVTPGYLHAVTATSAAFDDEGFFRMGDALRFVDPERIEQGLAFDGRIAEDFKLVTGTWVHVGALRLRLVGEADSLLQDAVIAGHNRDDVTALLFPSVAARRLNIAELRERLTAVIAQLNLSSAGSGSLRIARALIQHEPLQPDAGEITDKGYVNQRAVLERRCDQVERLYAQTADDEIIKPLNAEGPFS